MAKRTKILLLSIMGMFGLCAILLVALVSFLRSPAGSDFLLARAKGMLASRAHAKLGYDRGAFDPFSGAHFENLRLTQDEGENQIEIRVRQIDLRFTVSFLSRRINIETLSIDHPTVFVHYASSTDSAPSANKAVLLAPPVDLTLRKLALEHLEVDADYQDPRQKFCGQLRDTNLHLTLDWEHGRLSFAGNLTGLGRELTWTQALRRISVPDARVDLGLSSILLANQIQKLDAKGTVAVGSLVIERQQNGRNTRTAMGAQEISLNSNLGDDLTLDAKYHANGIFAPELFTRPVSAQAEMNAHVAKDFSRIQAQSQVAVDAIEVLRAEASARVADDGAKMKTQLRLVPDPRLAKLMRPAIGLGPAVGLHSQFDLDGQLDGKFVSLLEVVAGAWRNSSGQIKLDGSLKIKDQEALRFQSRSMVKGDDIQSDAQIEFTTGDYLDGLLTRKQLEQLGKWTAHAQVQIRANPAGDTLQENGTLTLTQVGAPSGLSVSLPEPLPLTHHVDLHQGRLEGELAVEVPKLEARKLGQISGSRLKAIVRSPDFHAARDFDLEVEMDPGEVALIRMPPFPGLRLTMKAELRNGDRISLNAFQADINRALLKLSAEASGSLKAGDFQSHGKLVLEVPADFPPLAGQTLRGRAEFPWTLSRLRKQEIDFEGDLYLKSLAWSRSPLRLSGISGHVPISEKLVWDGKGIRFANLVTQNPFERVDFERVRPLIQEADQVRIDEIGWEERAYGPLIGFFSVRQNMILAHQFDLDLGPAAGRGYGEMFFDAYPANLQFGVLSRLTGVNLLRVLPQRYLRKVSGSDQSLSGRSGLVVSLNKGSVDGRIDVTEIGGSQLITLINVLDPNFENEKLNEARSLLEHGYPTFVGLAFEQGYVDMDLQFKVLGVSQSINPRGIPISSWVSSATADIVKKTKEGPLK